MGEVYLAQDPTPHYIQCAARAADLRTSFTYFKRSLCPLCATSVCSVVRVSQLRFTTADTEHTEVAQSKLKSGHYSSL